MIQGCRSLSNLLTRVWLLSCTTLLLFFPVGELVHNLLELSYFVSFVECCFGISPKC